MTELGTFSKTASVAAEMVTANDARFHDKVGAAPHEPGTKDCPIFTTLSLLANKWSISLLHQLIVADGNTARFNALKKSLGSITQRELTKHLRQFEESGIVERTVYPESPPRVEYTLTPLGLSLCEPITALSAWAEKNGADIQKKRRAFAEKLLHAI